MGLVIAWMLTIVGVAGVFLISVALLERPKKRIMKPSRRPSRRLSPWEQSAWEGIVANLRRPDDTL